MSEVSELTFGVAIPAYQCVESLRGCLSSIGTASPSLFTTISVVDDSGDGRLMAALRGSFSTVQWTVHENNRGFGHSANDAVAACTADVVVLLNDDTELRSDPVPHLRQAFRNPDLFAATFQSLYKDGSFREGAKRLTWPVGMPRVLHNPKDQKAATAYGYPSAYAVGGHAAFHRKRFLLLGGFDPLFDPFYWEDVDLALRAVARGWPTIYLPECVVGHAASSAIRSKHDKEYIRRIQTRNRLLFAWRHLPGWLRPLHELSLAYHVTESLLCRRHTFLHAFRAAKIRNWEYVSENSNIG
ncbi:glycosyltransferase [bacterium]|nr:glycosyltransferase [bacterium]MBU1983191.1 glycosyltransferase [bacterium]